ncbi:hypothetical protein HYW82_04240 [Candidatus Peregrinibacteria bacterium]|nr:hypothetical protein [Candidatus Peregrinibacteria bacterium]
MFATSGDILNIALAAGFVVLVVFLCIFLFYGILILRDAAKVVDDVEEVVERVHKTIIQPLRAIDYIVEKATPYIEALIEKKLRGKKK